MDGEARSIVCIALALHKNHPLVPALEVLDLAMVGRHDSDPDFDDPALPEGDHTAPSTPFGRLLFDAFAPERAAEAAAAEPGTADPDLLRQVADEFARRYSLWGAGSG